MTTSRGVWRLARWGMILAGVVLVVYLGHPVALRAMGHYLILKDPLERVDAIVPLRGGMPHREMEVARLFREGYAPRVVLTRSPEPEGAAAMARLGYPRPEEQEMARMVLERLGVSADAILLIPEIGVNTREDMLILEKFFEAQGMRKVILVTSAYHARRTQKTWQWVSSGKVQALMHPAPHGRFDPDRWYHSRQYAELVLHEYLGLLNLWLGHVM